MNREIPINVYGADRSARRAGAQPAGQTRPAQTDRQRQWKSDRAQSLEEDLSILRARENPMGIPPRT